MFDIVIGINMGQATARGRWRRRRNFQVF